MTDTALALTKSQKAAAILVAMGKPTAGRLLKFFKQEELRSLIEGARQLRTIPQAELEKIVAEFETEFAEGAGLLDSADEMNTILSESMSSDEISAIMNPGDGKPKEAVEQPVWPQVEKLDAARLGAFLERENAQTAALVLSKVGNQTAAATLLTLPKAMRGEVVKRMMSMNAVPPAAMKLIESQLRTRLLADGSKKDTSAGQARVAGILNELDKNDLEEVMTDLAGAGAQNLDQVRARLFSFEDILLLNQRSRVALFDGIAADMVTTALRGAGAELTEAVLSSIGARSRRMIEAELATGTEGVAADAIAKARKFISSTAIRLSSEGSVELPSTQAAAA